MILHIKMATDSVFGYSATVDGFEGAIGTGLNPELAITAAKAAIFGSLANKILAGSLPAPHNVTFIIHGFDLIMAVTKLREETSKETK